MDTADRSDIPLLDQVKMQAQVLVPVLSALRAELGAAPANALVTNALREWSRRLALDIAARKPGTPVERWRSIVFDMLPRLADAVDVQMLRQEAGAVEFNVTGCRFADFFRQLGEPELGAVLTCESDLHVVAAAGGEVELTRTQTIMGGASHCNFRYRIRTPPSTT